MSTEPPGAIARDGQNVAHAERRLREEIISGSLPAGTVTSQTVLGKRLDIGRTPLREALRLLQHEGLVVNAPNRRVQIAELSAADVEELYVMRIGLETLFIRLSVPALVSRDIAELDGYMAQMEHFMQARDAAGFMEPHRAFHLRLVSAGGQRGLTQIAALFDHAERYRTAFGTRSGRDWEPRLAEHRAIRDAAYAGDADLAARRLAEHYAHTARLVFASLDPAYDPERLRTSLRVSAPGSEAALRT
jgi:DNA-binding GntR family transcriptional regulator